MKLFVSGRVRYKTTSGIGIFKKDVWTEKTFEVTLSPGEQSAPVTDVRLRCTQNGPAMHLEGNLKTQICYFAGFEQATVGDRYNFTMTSVRNIEFSGVVEIV